MKKILLLAIPVSLLWACGNSNAPAASNDPAANPGQLAMSVSSIEESGAAARHYKGALTKGMKGDSIFFDVSADGKRLENLTFKGYWYCSGKLESTIAGPDGAFTIVNNKVNHHISEPPGGGSTAWRFDLEATINGNTATGKFRMNINNLGCNTGMLDFTAQRIK